MKTFLAAVLEQQQKPLAIRVLEIPETLQVGQALVTVKYSGICGAQLGEISGTKGPDKYMPHLLGHEGSVVIVAAGPGVRNLRPGDHAVLHWRKGAGIECEPPKYWCRDLGTEVGGGWATSFNEMAIVSENRLTKIDKDVPMDIAALLGCAVTTGLGVVSNELNLKMGQSVVVFGCGGVGLNVIQGCMLASGYPIVGVDIQEEKLQQALVLGATDVVDNRYKDAIGKIKSIIGDRGADIVIDTTGKSTVMEAAWDITALTGKLCLIAQLQHDQKISLNTLAMHQGKTIVASDGGRTYPTEDIPRYIKLIESGRLNLESIITHRVKLSQINEILDNIRAGKVGRAIVEM